MSVKRKRRGYHTRERRLSMKKEEEEEIVRERPNVDIVGGEAR